MAERDGEFSAFLTGFVIGGLIGAAVALLFAPQSGEETRTYIKDKSIELKDRAIETSEQARERAEALAAEAKARADELAKQTREILQEQKQRVESALAAGKKAAEAKKQELSEGTSGEEA